MSQSPLRPKGRYDLAHTIRGIDILFLCTANQCRSPMAETILRSRLETRGIDAVVHSAGLMEGGFPATHDTLAALAERDLDASAHRSTRMDGAIVGAADLVLGMTRRHVVEAVVMAPAAWPRTFTLKEAVRRGQKVGRRPAGASLGDWLAHLHAGRSRADMLSESPLDDIRDPVTEPDVVSYADARDEIERNVDILVDLIWGAA